MNFKLDEITLMSYLYGELEGEEKDKVERYLATNEEARQEFEKLKSVRSMMGQVKDKEVIAPPIFVGDQRQLINWNHTYVKVTMSIAASLLLIMVVGWLTNAQVQFGNGELKVAFGSAKRVVQDAQSLTANDVQAMINSSLAQNNNTLQDDWKKTQVALDASIRENLKQNSSQINALVKQASIASQDQIQQYVSGIQTENAKLVKDYFQLSANDQKKYIEDLLVDFAKYVQQQRTNDLQVVQTRLNSLEKNTSMFKEETEQILTSIITRGNSTTKQVSNY